MAVGASRTDLASRVLAKRSGTVGRLGPLFLGGLIVLLLLLFAYVGPILTQYDVSTMERGSRLTDPTLAHPLGTDELGRDVLTRLMHGTRNTLQITVVAALVAALIGVLVGLVSGYAGSWTDAIAMRVTDSFLSVPIFILLLTAISLFGRTESLLILLLAFGYWMRIARITRAEIIRWRSEEFVVAAVCSGATHTRVVLRHLLPHAFPSILVAVTLVFVQIVLVEASLSFLGLGVQPPKPSLGNLLIRGQHYLFEAPLLAVYPGVVIVVLVVGVTYFGDGIRQVMDPAASRR